MRWRNLLRPVPHPALRVLPVREWRNRLREGRARRRPFRLPVRSMRSVRRCLRDRRRTHGHRGMRRSVARRGWDLWRLGPGVPGPHLGLLPGDADLLLFGNCRRWQRVQSVVLELCVHVLLLVPRRDRLVRRGRALHSRPLKDPHDARPGAAVPGSMISPELPDHPLFFAFSASPRALFFDRFHIVQYLNPSPAEPWTPWNTCDPCGSATSMLSDRLRSTAGVAQLARACACQAQGRRFDPGHPLSVTAR